MDDLRYGIAVPYLRAWRLKRLLSQAELARRARVSTPVISRGEQGQRIKVTKAAKLARVLGVDRTALLNGHGLADE